MRVLVGNTCAHVTEPSLSGTQRNRWRWRVFVRSASGVSLGGLVESADMVLHPSFKTRVHELRRASPDSASLESAAIKGYGTFEVRVHR